MRRAGAAEVAADRTLARLAVNTTTSYFSQTFRMNSSTPGRFNTNLHAATLSSVRTGACAHGIHVVKLVLELDGDDEVRVGHGLRTRARTP